MADFQIALESTLRQEDSQLKGTITDDTGGQTRFGISANANPEAFPAIIECDRDTALSMAGNIYRAKYWKFDDVSSQLVANKIFDMAVNMGVGTAIKIAQRVCGVPADGAWGPVTEAAINRMDARTALTNLRAAAVQHYKDIVASNPEKYQYAEADWLTRANS
jgi:lysozyme family protein